MIGVTYTCDHAPCQAIWTTPLTGDQIYNGVRIRNTYPHGWIVRTPRNGNPAMAYCPDHREGRAKGR